MERQTYSTLSRDSRLSKSSLQRLFYTYPDLSPEVKIIKRSAVNIQIDATCFKQFCVLCYQDNEDGCTQLIRIIDGEHYSEIKEDLDNLITLGVQIKSITTDRRKSALKAIRTSLPDVTVQRCFVHIKRMCLLWLTRFPKHPAGIELSALVLILLKISTHNDRLYRTNQLRS